MPSRLIANGQGGAANFGVSLSVTAALFLMSKSRPLPELVARLTPAELEQIVTNRTRLLGDLQHAWARLRSSFLAGSLGTAAETGRMAFPEGGSHHPSAVLFSSRLWVLMGVLSSTMAEKCKGIWLFGCLLDRPAKLELRTESSTSCELHAEVL